MLTGLFIFSKFAWELSVAGSSFLFRCFEVDKTPANNIMLIITAIKRDITWWLKNFIYLFTYKYI